jgi:hypothetical protein
VRILSGRISRVAFVVAIAVAAGCGSGSGRTASASATQPVEGSGISLPPGFPLGTWVVTISEADLRAAGLTNAGEIAENTGLFTRTMGADGRWTVVQTAPTPIRWPVFQGTFRTTGDHAWEETTTFPPEYAGDVVTMRWSLDGDLLQLAVENPPDAILPIITEAHPWQRS